jgi:hypothetical protein
MHVIKRSLFASWMLVAPMLAARSAAPSERRCVGSRASPKWKGAVDGRAYVRSVFAATMRPS